MTKQIDKRLELMEGTCKVCGQIKMVNAESGLDADYRATMECGCDEGRVRRAELRVGEKVRSVCGEASEMRGFTKLGDAATALIMDTAMSVMRDEILQAQIKVFDSVLTMTRKTNGLGIQRTKKIEIGEEALE